VSQYPINQGSALPGQSDGANTFKLDLRLATGAAAGWVATVLALGRASSTTLSWASGAAAVGVIALVSAYRGCRVAAVVALLVCCVAVVLLPLSVRQARAHDSPLAQLARQRVRVIAELTVTADPRLLAAKGPAGAPRTAVEATMRSVALTDRRVRLRGSVLILAAADGWHDVLPGQRVRLGGDLQAALTGDLLAAVLVARSDPILQGKPPWWQQMAGKIRASLRAACAGLPAGSRGLLPGLVDGDTATLDPILAEQFRVAGLTHLVAVSGMNCSVVLGACLLILRRMRCGSRICAVVGLAVLALFVVVARPSPSVLRAALMAAIGLFALAAGRPRDGVPLVSATVLGLLLWRPTLAVDVGFAMSVLATCALLIIAPGWAATLRRYGAPLVVAESLAVATAAHLVTAPLVAVVSGGVSLVAIPANVMAEPVVVVATVLGFCAAVVAPVSLTIGSVFAQLAGWPCRWLVWVAEFFGGMPGARLRWPGGLGGGALLVGVTAALVWLAHRRGSRRILAVGLVTCVLVQIPVRSVISGWPPAGWILIACNVGQGDGLVLPTGPHSAVVIDTGPDPVLMDRCLHDLAVTEVPLVVLTHYHLDHVGGLAGVFHGRRVRQVIAGPLPEPASGLSVVKQQLAADGMGTGSVTSGRRIQAGGVQLEVLGPLMRFRGTRSDPNNSSIVMRATVRGIRVLLPGDAEVEAQQSLVDAGSDVHAEVLKVPHHGSAYSTRAFLAAVGPKVAVISVGLHNDYGHPSPLLLSMLAGLGVAVRRTDHDGDVAVVAHGATLSTVVRTALTRQTAMPRRGLDEAPIRLPASRATMAACLTALPRRQNGPPDTRNRNPDRRPSCCCSGTRSCSSPVPSSRSPPQYGASTRRQMSANSWAANSTRSSCLSCSARLCLGDVGCSSSARRRISLTAPSTRCGHCLPVLLRTSHSCFSTQVASRVRRSWRRRDRPVHTRSSARG
jgi:competence protein ComEC